ncbi:probable ATP-dependent RNA helicase ddx20 [Chenopodium quinoa]|uniref:probable ATP-dependent RNA helicase ddx20 n=1 Tax=Chenopodium quinoa TaxID=63459 RepID=UPI000B797A6E|nr:probable ATP-dependent RNA helicase ddx20 [Chenopodium quinoa]
MTPKIDTKTMYQQKLQNKHQSPIYYQFLKMLIPFSMTFSVFALLFLHPSRPPFFHSLISHLSTFSCQLFSLAADKNYIFLLCNGILVFIAKYSSGSVDTSSPPLPETSPDNDLYYKAYSQTMQSSIGNSLLVEDAATNEDENENELEENEIMPNEDVEEKHVVYQITDGTIWEEVEEEKYEDVIINDNKENKKEHSDSWSYEEQEEDNYKYYAEQEDNYEYYAEQEEDKYEYYAEQGETEQEEEAIAQMSTEELNRKFDDFIRKMKEDLRIEAQRQLIVV